MKLYLLTAALLCCLYGYGQKIIPVDSVAKIQLEQVVISATRFKESKEKIAQQVLSLTAKEMAFYNQPTTAELLTHSGGVNVQKSQLGGGSPVIRGFEANKILIVVDGIRLNNAIYRGGHLQNVITIDNSILEKTEILYGPSSVLYGSDALGGVISFYSKNPLLNDSSGKKLIQQVNSFLRYSTAYNEKTAHVDFSIGGKKLASLTSFNFTEFGNLTQGADYYDRFPQWGKRTFYVETVNGVDTMKLNPDPEKQLQTGYKQYDVFQKFLWRMGKTESIINLQYSTSSDIPRYDRLTLTNSAGIARNAEWYYGPQERLLVAWHLQIPATSFYDRAQLTTAYQSIEESRHNRNFKSPLLNHRIENVQVVSINADFNKTIRRNIISYGTEAIYNKVNSKAFSENINTNATAPIDTRYPGGGSHTQSYALYLTGARNFTSKISGRMGVRFTKNNLSANFTDTMFFPFPFDNIEQAPASLAANASMVYLSDSKWKVSLSAATGFRTPNVDDLAKVFESGNGTLIIPNPMLKPEKTVNYEVGIHKVMREKFSIATTFWYTRFTNIVTTDFTNFNGSDSILYNGSYSKVITTVNKNQAFVLGTTVDVNWQLNKHFRFATIFNYSYGRIIERPVNYPLDHIPPIFGKVSITGKFDKLAVELYSLYNGEKATRNYNLRGEDNESYSADPIKGYTPAWATLNTRSSYNLSRHFTIQFAIENIMNKFYRVFSSGLSAPGRNFVITLKTKI